jgi:hypothetical protein
LVIFRQKKVIKLATSRIRVVFFGGETSQLVDFRFSENETKKNLEFIILRDSFAIFRNLIFKKSHLDLRTSYVASCSSTTAPKSISTGAQYVTLDNKIKCLSVAVFFVATPPIKL